MGEPLASSRVSCTSRIVWWKLHTPQFILTGTGKATQLDAWPVRTGCLRLQDYLLESFAASTEGLMLKALVVGAAYQPSKRSDSWIKIKRCAGVAPGSAFSLETVLGLSATPQVQKLLHCDPGLAAE